jgi:hypothetical protein
MMIMSFFAIPRASLPAFLNAPKPPHQRRLAAIVGEIHIPFSEWIPVEMS